MASLCDDATATAAASSSIVTTEITASTLESVVFTASLILTTIFAAVTDETASASSLITSENVGITVQSTAGASSSITSDSVIAYPFYQSTASATSSAIEGFYDIAESTAGSSSSIISTEIVFLLEEIAAASSSDLSFNIVTVLYTDEASAGSSLFSGSYLYESEASASSSVTQWNTVLAPLMTSTASASSSVFTDSLSGSPLLISTAAASDSVWQSMVAIDLIVEQAWADSSVFQNWDAYTVWSADTTTFGMTQWDYYADNLVAGSSDWFALCDGNIVRLEEEIRPATNTVAAWPATPEYTICTATASQIDGDLSGTMCFAILKASGNTDWQYAQAKVKSAIVGDNTQAGLLVRMSRDSSDAFSAFALLLRENRSLSIAHFDVYGGTPTIDSLGVLESTSPAIYSIGDTVGVSVSGYGNNTEITAWVNGSPVLTHSLTAADKGFMLTGQQGIMHLQGAAVVLSNFEAGTMQDHSIFSTGMTDFSEEKLKHVNYFRTAYRSADPLTVTIGNTGDGEEVSYSYEMEPRIAMDTVPGRAKLGRGSRSRHWRVGVETSGKPFVMRDTSLEIEPVERKI